MPGYNFSDAYVQHLLQGPFPGLVDPWAEDDHFFHQIHGRMLDHFLTQINMPPLKMGYYAGTEISLQITAGREPDVFLQSAIDAPAAPSWDYETAAVELLAEPGIALHTGALLQAVRIYRRTGELVTVVEVVSAGNKDRAEGIADYQMRRERLVLEHQVNVVEIDLTRSNKRLITHPEAARHAYHTAIFLPGAHSRLIGMGYGEPLKRIALPLHGEAVPVELQAAYNYGYHQNTIAAQLENSGQYSAPKIHMPSLLSDSQKRSAVESVERWRDRLKELDSA